MFNEVEKRFKAYFIEVLFLAQISSLVPPFHGRFDGASTTPIRKCHGQTTTEIPRSTRFKFTLLLLVRNCLCEALPDCTLWACDTMRHHNSDRR